MAKKASPIRASGKAKRQPKSTAALRSRTTPSSKQQPRSSLRTNPTGKQGRRTGGAQTINQAGISEDITARKRAKAALNHSYDLLKSFVEHTPAAVAMFDRDLRYLAVSRRWLQDYQLSDRSIIGLHHYDVFPEIRHVREWQEIHQRCLAGAIERREEDSFTREDGCVNWLRWEVRPWRDGSGQIGGIMMLTEVITERKRMEEALRESEERFRALYDDTPFMYFTVSQDGTVLSVNSFGATQLGYAQEELIGLSVLEVFYEEDKAAVVRNLADAFSQPARIAQWTFRKVR